MDLSGEREHAANAVYILKTITERSKEVQQDLYLCFTDYKKDFDTVKHQEIMTTIEDINIDGKDLRIIKTCTEKKQLLLVSLFSLTLPWSLFVHV